MLGEIEGNEGNFDDGLWVQEVINAVEISHHERRWVSLPLDAATRRGRQASDDRQRQVRWGILGTANIARAASSCPALRAGRRRRRGGGRPGRGPRRAVRAATTAIGRASRATRT